MIGRYLRAILRKGWWWAERLVTLARPGLVRFSEAFATEAEFSDAFPLETTFQEAFATEAEFSDAFPLETTFQEAFALEAEFKEIT